MFYRSFHFIPLSNKKFLLKIPDLASDFIVLDLEDGVSGSDKESARENFKRFCSSSVEKKKNVFLRINTENSVEFEKDLMLLNNTQWEKIMLPKASLELVEKLNSKVDHDFGLFPLFETIKSLNSFEDILTAMEDISFVGLGMEDILAEEPFDQVELEEYVRNIKNSFVLKSKGFGVKCIDGVSLDFNLESFLEICRHSKSFGFEGKMSIHPNQIDLINNTWSISHDQYLEAKKYTELIAEDDQTGYVKYKNAIITPPKIKKYQTIVKSYEKKIQ